MSTTAIVIQVMGGLGLFLIGMIIMTDGLHSLAGNTIRQWLMRFTHSPASGAATGAISTAILQSSSATTVAAVGFVGTGILSFPAALGIIFGANIGTTITGWLVALVGFKLQIATLLLPVIFIGAVLKLFTRGTAAAIGYALAGLGVIFIGINTLQAGMSSLETLFSFNNLPADSWLTRIQLVFLGIIFTLVTQSSSAGVASALTALFTGLINFEQAAALVIGMDIGTTVTAYFATIGGSIGAKRTGYSHVIYNLFTGFGALLLITPYSKLWEAVAPGQLIENAEIALVGFHTSFNFLGVVIAVPLTHHFERLIVRLVPEKQGSYGQMLDPSLLSQPELALNASLLATQADFSALLQHTEHLLSNGLTGVRMDVKQMQKTLDKTQDYIDNIHLTPQDEAQWPRLIAIIHVLDHLQRLHERCEEDEDRAVTARDIETLLPYSRLTVESLQAVDQYLKNHEWLLVAAQANKLHHDIHSVHEGFREDVMKSLAQGDIDMTQATDHLEAIRWLRRVSRHLDRISYHLVEAYTVTGNL
ncbi:Na/Pi cotransporter family protein [Reinekea marinisedimentorum]|uniref:Phosphate:Na+ symporter n=1 Tax=Reinekea marinisedimentorum TaxID=230495 RepID=A0A4R3HZZ7_9GAMM|nr:Na/Pi symporter [Reinekea marinisedimentorum]TCS38842.1 phosphate:Na+ symporter [Reinekea marinisedimentorum]